MTTTTERPATATRLPLPGAAPDTFDALLAFDRAATTGIDPALAELVRLRVSQLNGCGYCVDLHSARARAGGESERRLFALPAWRATPFFSTQERAALALAEAVTDLADGQVPDEVYDAAARHFGQFELTQLIWVTVAANAWNRAAVATRLGPVPG